MDLTYLTTMAQIFGVLTGFSTLLNAFIKSDAQTPEHRLNRFRVSSLMELGLISIFFCVIPMIFQSKDQVVLGKVLSALLGLVSLINAVINFSRVKKMTGLYFPVPYFSLVTYVLAFGIAITGILNAFELYGRENVIIAYELVILTALLLQSYFFVRLFYWGLANQKN